MRSSNAGHYLFSGIASPARGWRVAHTLLKKSVFSGWGKDGAVKVLEGLFAASLHFDLHRMPELFCGFCQRSQGPTLYPVACAPQTWAAGAVFLLLQACLGLEIDAVNKKVCFDRPELPESLGQVPLRNLRIGKASLDIVL